MTIDPAAVRQMLAHINKFVLEYAMNATGMEAAMLEYQRDRALADEGYLKSVARLAFSRAIHELEGP